MTPWWTKSATDLAEAIRTKQASSREIVGAHLERIEAVNGAVNALVHRQADAALEAADRADAQVARGHDDLPPLHGVPFTLKDNIDQAGIATTCGLRALADDRATHDAPVVERMKAAGAIALGRTNLPDMAVRFDTESQLYGRTLNPYDATRSCGGSSGGEAVALATGMSPLGLGNDLGGSLRNPAHCCGVAALKPSLGAIPWAAHGAGADKNLAFQLMAAEGPMARTVADLRAAFEVLAGPDPRDPLSAPLRFREPAPGTTLRIAVMARPPGGTTHPGIVDAVERAAAALAEAGHIVEEATPPAYETLVALWARILFADLRPMRPMLDGVLGEACRAFVGHLLGTLPRDELAALHEVYTMRFAIARQWQTWLTTYSILLGPVWTEPAFVVGRDISSQHDAQAVLTAVRPVLPANVLGIPAVVVPVARVDGLPIGVQIMGPRFSELQCLAVAQELEERLGAWAPVDPVRSR